MRSLHVKAGQRILAVGRLAVGNLAVAIAVVLSSLGAPPAAAELLMPRLVQGPVPELNVALQRGHALLSRPPTSVTCDRRAYVWDPGPRHGRGDLIVPALRPSDEVLRRDRGGTVEGGAQGILARLQARLSRAVRPARTGAAGTARLGGATADRWALRLPLPGLREQAYRELLSLLPGIQIRESGGSQASSGGASLGWWTTASARRVLEDVLTTARDTPDAPFGTLAPAVTQLLRDLLEGFTSLAPAGSGGSDHGERCFIARLVAREVSARRVPPAPPVLAVGGQARLSREPPRQRKSLGERAPGHSEVWGFAAPPDPSGRDELIVGPRDLVVLRDPKFLRLWWQESPGGPVLGADLQATASDTWTGRLWHGAVAPSLLAIPETLN